MQAVPRWTYCRRPDAQTALDDSLKLIDDGTVYNAYRDFEADEDGKFPYGILINSTGQNSNNAQVLTEDGNTFLRTIAESSSGKTANLLLPYHGEVTADAGQQIVVEYRARFLDGSTYMNLCLPNNQANQATLAVALEKRSGTYKVLAQNGSSDGNKTAVAEIEAGTWYMFKIVIDMDAQTYDVYLTEDGGDEQLIAENFGFRCANKATSLVNHRFGPDKGNAQVDFDDFKVYVTGATAPTIDFKALDEMRFAEGQPAEEVALTATVSNGQTVSFAAESQDTAVATCAVTDGKLTVTPVAVGETTITVIASAVGCEPVTQTFDVRVTALTELGSELLTTVNAMWTAMEGNSYPLGDGLGCYSQASYDAVLAALTDAETVARAETLEQEEAEAALAKITDAQAALDDSLNLTDGTVTYNAYRDFESDVEGKFPYGI